MDLPLGELKYLYVGTSRFDEDLAFYGQVLGARVAAFPVAVGPLLLIEIPDGPCHLFRDKSGNELAVFGNVRPDALGAAVPPRPGL